MAHFFSFFSRHSNQPAVTELSSQMLAFLEQYPLALLLVDATGHITFANHSALRLLRTEQEVLTSSYVDRFGLTMQKVREMAHANPPKKIIIELINDQADSVFVGAAASFLASTPFILLTLESIPHYSRLIADNLFLRSIVDATPAAVVVQNLGGTCLLWSKQAHVFFGYKETEVVGQEIYPFLPKELVPSLQRMDGKILQQRASQEPVTLSYKNKLDTEVVLTIKKVFIPADNGKDLCIVTLFEDSTQRYHYEQDLLQNRTLLRAVLDNVPLGLYTRDCDSKVTFYNRQSLKVLNEQNEDNVSRAHAYQTQQDTNFHRSREQEILKEGKIKDYPAEPYTDSFGNKKILHLRKVPLMDAGPKPLVLSIVEDITEHLQQENEIKRVNNLLTSIVQNVPVGLYARDANGRMLMRNNQCSLIFGVEEDSMFDENGALPQETPQQISQYMAREQQLIESGKTIYIPEESYQLADGTTKLLRMIKVPVDGGEKEEKFVVTLVEDITERKAQEKDLEETKNFLQTLLDNVPVSIYARSADDKIMFVNRRAREMFPGENEGEQIGEPDFYDKREQSIFENGKVIEIPEEKYTTKTGQNLLLHLIKAPVFDKEGKPFLVLTVAEDITLKKAQEREIIDAKNFLQSIINNLPVSLSVKTYDGKYILWNKKSEELFGVSSQEVIGRTSYRTDINKEQQEFVREGDLRVFESKKEQNIAQELISTAREGVKIMHTVKTPVFHEDGTPNCLIVVSEDITAKTRMEKQIREASDKNTLLVENAREGVLLAEDHKVMYANQAMCHILGYNDMNELVGTPLADLVSTDYQDLLKEKYEAVISGAEDAEKTITLSLRTKQAQPCEVEFAAVASRYLGRRIVLCFMRDITQFNRAQRELVRERESYRLAFEKSPLPSFILLSNGYISLMNEACRHLFGFKETDKTFYRNVYIRPGLSLAVRRKMRQGEEANMEYSFNFAWAAEKFPGRLDPDRANLKLHLEFVPVNRRNGKDGSVAADYVVGIRVHEKPTASSHMQLLRKPLPPTSVLPVVAAREMLVLPNSEPYVLCGADFKMKSCNELFCELCQLNEQELLGQDIRSIMDDKSLVQFEADLHQLASEGTLANRDYHINPASGLERIAVRLSAVKEEGGKYLFVLRNQTLHLQLVKVLEERSAQLNALLESTNGVVFTVQLNKGKLGALDNVSQYLSQKVGFSQDELTRMQFKELFVNTKTTKVTSLLAQAQKTLTQHGKTSFVGTLKCKDGSQFEAQVILTSLELPGQEAALVVLRDVSAERDAWSRTSKEAQELQSVRTALPGMYLKTDSKGKALEVYSNLAYLPQEQAQQLCLHKTLDKYWSKEATQRALFTVKEALAMNIASNFELEWKLANTVRYFNVSVTPVSGQDEVILWLKDISQGRTHEEQVRQLYALTSEPGLSMTQQVDKILEFGLKTFHSDVGFVLRFAREADILSSHVMYVTPNDLQLERSMSFKVEECLYDVADGRVLVWPDLSATSCHNCVHIKKALGSLVAAPLLIGGKVMGALCFASTAPRRGFENGTEELLGLLGRMLAMRIELRQSGKMLSEASRAFARTLEYVDKPAAMLDLDYQITFINDALLSYTGRHLENMMGRNFFEEIVRNADISKRTFKEAQQQAFGSTFEIPLEIRTKKGTYEESRWQVIPCKDDKGDIASYGLMQVK